MAIKWAFFLQLALVAATSPECQSNNAEWIADPSEEPSADELNVQLLQNKLEHKHVSSNITVKGIKEDEMQPSVVVAHLPGSLPPSSSVVVGTKAILYKLDSSNCDDLGHATSNVLGRPLGIELGPKSGDEQEQSSDWKSLSCEEAAEDLGFTFDSRSDIKTPYRPPGCYQGRDGKFYFNNQLSDCFDRDAYGFQGKPVCQLPSCQMLNEKNTGPDNPDGVCRFHDFWGQPDPPASSCSSSGSQCPVNFDLDASDMPVQAELVKHCGINKCQDILEFKYCDCCKESCPTTVTLTCPQMLEQLQTEKEHLRTENEILRAEVENLKKGICPSST